MRGLILFLTLLVSASLRADIQDRMTIFTQQTNLFRQICFLPDGTFLADRILFDAHSSIRETAVDCNAQALALRSEYNAIDAFTDFYPRPLKERNLEGLRGRMGIRIEGGGHFLQEDRGPQLAQVVVDLVARTAG